MITCLHMQRTDRLTCSCGTVTVWLADDRRHRPCRKVIIAYVAVLLCSPDLYARHASDHAPRIHAEDSIRSASRITTASLAVSSAQVRWSYCSVLSLITLHSHCQGCRGCAISHPYIHVHRFCVDSHRHIHVNRWLSCICTGSSKKSTPLPND